MNYIEQLNGFRDRRRLHPLLGQHIGLYMALLEQANPLRWPQRFQMAGPYLSMMAGLSPTALRRGRQVLVEQGYITYEGTVAGHPGYYGIVPLRPEASGAAKAAEQGGPDAGGAAKRRGRGGQSGAQAAGPLYIDKPKQKDKPKPKPEPQSPAGGVGVEILHSREWREYEAMRQSLGAPLNSWAREAALRQLQAMAAGDGQRQRAILPERQAMLEEPLPVITGDGGAQPAGMCGDGEHPAGRGHHAQLAGLCAAGAVKGRHDGAPGGIGRALWAVQPGD